MSVKTQDRNALPAAFDQAAVRALSASAKEGEERRRFREEALARAVEAHYPERTEESWRRTDPNRFRLDELRPSAGTSSTALPEGLELPSDAAGFLHTSDGAVVELRSPALAGGGLFDFATASREHPDDLRQRVFGGVAPAAMDRFSALTAAFTSGGAYLRIPKGQALAGPVVLLHRFQGGDQALFLHTVLHVEEGAEATVLEILHGDDGSAGQVHQAVDVLVERGATLHYLRLQDLGDRMRLLTKEKLQVRRDAHADWNWGVLGGAFSKTETEARMLEPGGHAMLNGFYYGRGRMHFDHQTFQNHVQGQTVSDLLYKGVLVDQARSVYMGLIRIQKDAQKSDAYQANRNLLLSPEARTDSIPSLEIEANEVRCTHGATMGQVDEEQVFYLVSRGLSREEATQLIVEGFYEPVFDRFGSRTLADVARARLLRRMPG